MNPTNNATPGGAILAMSSKDYRCISTTCVIFSLAFAGTAQAQQVQSSGSTGTTFTTPIGATLTPTNPAAPIPSPALSYGLSQPERRGYINAEPFFIYPTVRLSMGQVQNLNYAQTDKVNSPIIQVAPRFTAEAKSGGQTHSMTYQGLYSRYSKSSDDNTNDHELIGRTRNQFSSRADLAGEAYYLHRNEPRGQFARAIGNSPDQFNAFGFNGTFGYGAQAAQGRFEFDLGATDKTYKNNPAITKALDVTSFNVAGRFLYRIAPRVRALAEVRDTEYNYKSSSFDNSERRLLFGVSMDASAAIAGTAKIGVVNKAYRDGAFKDYTAAAAEVALRWTPLTYSSIDLLFQRIPQDTTGLLGTNGSVNTVLGGYWVHRWQSYVGSYAAFSYVNQDYRNLSRTDKVSGVNVGVYFDPRTWLRLSVDYSMADRKSLDSTAEYRRDALMFTVGVTL